MKNKTIIYIYNSFKDPLFQNLMYKYIQSLTNKGLEFYLITFEQPEYHISKKEKIELKAQLKQKGITWKPFSHSTGKFLLFKKLYDLLSVFWTILSWRIFGRAKNIMAFANVSASHCGIYSSLMGLKLFIYSYEPHAEFQVELGLWSKSSLKYKLLSFFEKHAAKKAKLIFTGTKYGVDLVHSISPNTPTFRLPTSVDENEFYYKSEAAATFIEENNLEGKKRILYIGKFGDLYYEPSKLISLYQVMYQLDDSCHFIIITSYPLDQLKALISNSTIPLSNFYLDTKISYEDVKIIISASDIGLSIVPPMENQKYRSPTKVAEYLLCGLPYVTCIGVSEDDTIAIDYNVGTVINELSPQYATQIHEYLSTITSNRNEFRERCRKTGLAYRGKSNVDKAFNDILLPLLTNIND